MRVTFIKLALVLFLLTGKVFGQYCTSTTRYSDTPIFTSSQISKSLNVKYGAAKDYKGTSVNLLMDVYYPNATVDNSAKRPFILLIHGGGFISGTRNASDLVQMCNQFAMRGYVCATMSYRLGGQGGTEYDKFKARYRAIQDAHAALRFVVKNATTYKIDTNWLFIGGQSAGALTSFGVVYGDQDELNSASLLLNTKTVGSELGSLFTSGNTIRNTYTIKGIFNNWGSASQSEMDIDEMIPTVSFHGELDTTVPIDSRELFPGFYSIGSRTIHNTLLENNICSELSVDLNEAHGIYRDTDGINHRVKRASCFFKSIFCNTCSSLYTTEKLPSNCSANLRTGSMDIENSIKVYPNPFNDTFKIEGVEGTLNLTFYNSLGQIVAQKTTVDGNVVVDLNPGVYMMSVENVASGQIQMIRLIRN